MEVQGAAYVLHKRAYQNSSVIINLFTQNYGLIDVVAKRVMLKSGKFRFNLQLFQLLEIHGKGKGTLLNLYSSEALGSPAVLEGKSLFCRLYINELLIKLLPKHDIVLDIFQLYQVVQTSLCVVSAAADLEILLRKFEIQLLVSLGYGIHFVEVVSGEILQNNTYYYYQMEHGFLPLDSASIRGNNYFTGETLRSISVLDFSDAETRRQAKLLLRSVINHHLGGKFLKSRELFQ